MKITFIDGVPGIGVTRGLTEANISTHSTTKNGRLILPSFADIGLRNRALYSPDMSGALMQITRSLVTRIEQAEEKGRDLILGGSPISYYVFALLKGKRLSTESILLYEDIMKAVGNSSDAFLLKRTPGYSPNAHKLLLMNLEEVQRFGAELETEYTRLMGGNLSIISKIEDGIGVIA